MKNIFNSVVVGCGVIHIAHINGILQSNTSTLYGVCDLNASLVEQVAKEHNCKCYHNYNEVLEDNNVDVIHLCTPHYLHFSMTIQALQAGKHVLCEKPMAISVEECLEMEQASLKYNKTLGISLQNRYNAASLYILDILASKRLGSVLGGRAFVTWDRDIEYYTRSPWRGKLKTEGGGCLINQAIHTLDLLQLFCCFNGNEIESISANVSTKRHTGIIEVEDTADACLYFNNGSRALFYASNAYVSNAPISIELICQHGTISLYGSTITIHSNGGVETVNLEDLNLVGKGYWGSGHDSLIADFYDCLENERTFPVGPKQAMEVIKIIQTIYKSSSNGALAQPLEK